jgi:hypothetical protein
VIPACEYLPREAILGILEASKRGVPVFFVERRPRQDMTLQAVPEEFAVCGTIVSLENLAAAVQKAAPPPVFLDGAFPSLRLYSVAQDGAQVVMLFNEHHAEPACFQVKLPPGVYSRLVRYDGTANAAESWKIENDAFPVRLESGEAVLYLLDGQQETASLPVRFNTVPIECDWNFSSSPENDGVFSPRDLFKAGSLPNLHTRRDLSDFAGAFRYTGTFDAKKTRGRCILYFPRISDCATVKINGTEAGEILGNSGRLDITAYIRDGQNEVSVDIATTLVKKIRDPISCYMGVGPLGMTRAPVLEYYS